jgi:anti-sigma factor RsiW
VTCDELRPLMHGYVDGELDLVHHLEVEQHLESCSGCARACKRLQVLQATLRTPSFRFEPPPELRRRVEASLREPAPVRPMRRPRLWLAVASCAAMFAITVWGVSYYWATRMAEDRVVEEVVASHVRSLMVEHLTDITSTDQHTVRPWFNGKIDFSPPIHDLSRDGFTLVGGRLDYVNNRLVVALVYSCRKHKINVLIWPSSSSADEEPRFLTRQTYQLIHASWGGMTRWAVSDLNAGELREFMELMRRRDQP